MSLKLLKQSLEIIESDSIEYKTKNDESKQKSTRVAKTSTKINKHNFNKQKFFVNNSNERKNLKDIQQELQRTKKKSEENLRRLLALSQNTLKGDQAEKIVRRAHKGRYENIKIPKREIESIFTEEDFRAFEEEYFNS